MAERAQDNLLRAFYMMHKDNQRFSSSVRDCFFLLFRKHHNIFLKKVLHIGLLGIMITTDLYFLFFTMV